MLIQLAFVVFVAGSCSWSAGAVECYSCVNVTRIPDCIKNVQCPSGSACFTNYSTVQGVRLYTLGCTSVWSCPIVTTSSTGGASIIGRSTSSRETTSADTCSQCCTTGHCNRQHCQNADPSCIDDDVYDCAAMGVGFDICADVSHAKIHCKRFCGFCYTIDGQWAAWSEWSRCDVTCGNGTMTKTRTCSDPPPENGGSDCSGETKLHKACTKDLCPIHGGWSSWSEWGSCSASCDVGLQRRDRTCSNPYPARNGEHCYGDARDDRLCAPGACANGSWSSWGPWGACTRTCGGGVKTRIRNCDSPPPSITGNYCDGHSFTSNSCNISPCQGPVVFMAKHLSDTTPGHNEPMVFTQVDTNVGNGYDSSTGIFTAPVAGTYSFNVQFCAYGNKYAVVALFVNSVQKTSMSTYGDAGHTCRTLTYPAVLKQGDKVQAKTDPDSGTGTPMFTEDRYRRNSFSGALLR